LSLLVRVKAREPRAWERFVALYGPLVYHWCREAGLQASDAADVGQEVFWAVAQGLEGFRYEPGRGTFRGWLRRITQHKVRDFIRRAEEQARGVGGSDVLKLLERVLAPDGDDREGIDDLGERQVLYLQALEMVRAEFEEKSWAAFWRVAVEGERAADVAGELGMSTNAVYVVRCRILARLREEFAGLIDFDEGQRPPDKIAGPDGASPQGVSDGTA